jgi:hypothetical protein
VATEAIRCEKTLSQLGSQFFYAYNHFGQHPERLIGWFDKHMAK